MSYTMTTIAITQPPQKKITIPHTFSSWKDVYFFVTWHFQELGIDIFNETLEPDMLWNGKTNPTIFVAHNQEESQSFLDSLKTR